MKIFDISVSITPSTPVWPGDPNVNLKTIGAIQDGDSVNITEIQMCVHTGTHIDAPSHYINTGATIDQIPIEKLIGKAAVIEMDTQVDVITESILVNHPQWEVIQSVKKVLFKTRNSAFWQSESLDFRQDYVGIDTSGAQVLANLDLDLIGVDYLSISTFHDSERPHLILLSKDIVLLEGIDLSAVQPGIYNLFCLPINILGCEGAPARVILAQQA